MAATSAGYLGFDHDCMMPDRSMTATGDDFELKSRASSLCGNDGPEGTPLPASVCQDLETLPENNANQFVA